MTGQAAGPAAWYQRPPRRGARPIRESASPWDAGLAPGLARHRSTQALRGRPPPGPTTVRPCRGFSSPGGLPLEESAGPATRRRSTGFAVMGQTMTEPSSPSAPGQELRATAAGKRPRSCRPVARRAAWCRGRHTWPVLAPTSPRRGPLSLRRSMCSPPSVTRPTRRGREGRTGELEV